jgi:transcriptional regulator with XRE-family HTH domain
MTPPPPPSDPDARSDLGDFLRSRRARLRPEDVGLRPHPGVRRVPGLRREELAIAAGVSVTHYTRLEQGRGDGTSDQVLDAVATALRLGDDERAHLKDLARPAGKPRRPAPARPSPGASPAVRSLLDAMTDVPAVLLDHRNGILAWNRAGHALLAGHLDLHAPDHPADRPNLTALLFLGPHGRRLHRHWDEEAELAVASLRLVAGRHPHDHEISALVGRLATHSPEFAALWARHPVRTCSDGVKHLRHPAVGPLDLHFQSLTVPGGADHRIIAYSAEPGTPSEAALRLLTSPGPGAAGAPTAPAPESSPGSRPRG